MFCYMPQSMISLMKEQFVVTHKIRQAEISAVVDIWVTNTAVKILCPQENYFYLYFRITCFSVDLLTTYQVFLSPVKVMSADYDKLLFYERYLTILFEENPVLMLRYVA